MKRITSYFDWLPLAAGIIALTTVLTALPSCESTGPHVTDDPTIVQAAFSETVNLVNEAKKQAILLRAKRDQSIVGAGPPLSPDEAASLARIETQINELSNLLMTASAAAAAANRPVDGGDIVTGLVPLLPPPFNIIGGILGGALTEAWRTRKKRKSFDRLVGAINSIKKKNAKFADAMNEAGPELRAEMGTEAKAEVDKLRGAVPKTIIDRVRMA